MIQHSGLPRFAVTAANRSACCGVALTGALTKSTALVVAGRGLFFALSACLVGAAIALWTLLVGSSTDAGCEPAGQRQGQRDEWCASAANRAAGAFTCEAGWSSLVARQAHNLEVVGSSPTPATNARSCGSPVGGAHLCPSDREMASSRTRPQHRTPGKTFVLLGVTAGETAPSFCAMGGHGDPQTGRTSLGPSAAVCSAAPRSFARTDCGAEIKVAGSTPASRSRSAIRNTAVTGKTGQRQTGRSAILRVNADVTGGERPAPYSGRP